jgi:hypothetical protein
MGTPEQRGEWRRGLAVLPAALAALLPRFT